MYKYLHSGKNYGLRVMLRKLRLAIIVLTFPLIFILIPLALRNYLFGVTGLALLLFILELGRNKKQLLVFRRTSIDWIIITGFNLYITSIVLLSGGMQSPLIGLLLTPTLVFTAEFGLFPGVVDLTFLTLVVLGMILEGIKASSLIWINGLVLLLITGLVFWLITFKKKIFSRYHRKVMRLLIEDDLTGLFNRRFLKTKIHEEINHRRPFALIMVDINYFKYFNDHWGHPRGDLLLNSLAQVLKQAVEKTDMVIRTSGDEFIILMPQSNQAKVEKTMELISRLLEERDFPGEDCFPKKKLSISYGSVLFPDQATSFESLMETVDSNLYQNKKHR